jgi:hypothetical protein
MSYTDIFYALATGYAPSGYGKPVKPAKKQKKKTKNS